MELFRQALQDLGWVNGRNVTFDERWADRHFERLPRLAAELVGLRVDVIVASAGTPAVEAALKATHTIPIVFPTIGDPVAQKIVQSMAHPGGNATGLTNMGTEVDSKRMALLKEAVPGIRRVALLINGANSYSAAALSSLQTSSGPLGIQLQAFDVRTPDDFEKVFVAMSRSGIEAVVVEQDAALQENLKQLGDLALKHRLPFTASLPETGVLVANDRDGDANYRRAATYVDKILDPYSGLRA